MTADTTAVQLARARRFARAAQLDELLQCCDNMLAAADLEVGMLLEIAALLLAYGFLSKARVCLQRAQSLEPTNPATLLCLANLELEAGNVSAASQRYLELLQSSPSEVLYHNLITCMQYDPQRQRSSTSCHGQKMGTLEQ